MTMKFLLLLLALCVTASAAPLPPPMPPVVKRPAPLQSPKAASATKDKQMLRPASVGVSDSPPVPLKGSWLRVNSEYGTYEFTCEAFQPAGNSILFEKSGTLGDWEPLGYNGPQPFNQTTFAALYSFSESLTVRVKVTPIVSTMKQTGWMPASLVPATGSNAYKNPTLPGARVWSVRK